MIKEILIFELQYRKARAATYVYFVIIFLLSFIIVTSPTLNVSGVMGLVKANSPYVLSNLMVVFSFVFTIITSSVMGVAIVRDFDNNTEEILFTTPLKKIDYLLGRYAGSMLVLIIINFAMILGIMSGFLIGKYLPWAVAWHYDELIPFNPWHYLQPFLLFVLVNIFTMGSFFFMSGALWRNSIIIYTQGVILLVLYLISNIFLDDLNLKHLAALLDPFGLKTFQAITAYWTAAEKNTMLLPLTGDFLLNRMIWFLLGITTLIITYYGFTFNTVRKTLVSKKIAGEPSSPIRPETVSITYAKTAIGFGTHVHQLISLSFFYFRLIWTEIPFIAIVTSGVLLLIVNATKINLIYGTSSHPTTGLILGMINNSFNLFLVILAIFYSGELVWKERSAKVSLIMDTIPLPDYLVLLSKYISTLLMYCSVLFILVFCGMIVQVYHGYYDFNFPLYLGTLFSQTFSALAIFTLLYFFVQVIVNNKFHGFAICILFQIINSLLVQLGFEHSLWRFGSGSLGVFSEMNTYGHFILPFLWLRIYWSGLALFLFTIAILLVVRGSEEDFKIRLKMSRLRMNSSLIIFALSSIVLFIFSGLFIYYNTKILNDFKGISAQEKGQVQYENEVRKYSTDGQPKIVEVNINVELFPGDRNFNVEGFYYLKNKTKKPITRIHVQHNLDDQIDVSYLHFDREYHVEHTQEKFKHFIYTLRDTLNYGDSVRMDFRLSFKTKGFVDGKSNTDIVYNGTFFNNSYLPSLGYNDVISLGDNELRHKYGLKDMEGMRPLTNLNARETNLFGDDADHIRFEATVSTVPDQVAIAPGNLLRQWTKNNRAFFQYKMEKPMSNFYSIVSGRYAVLREQWNGINLEIYYHPGHDFNLSRMMTAMKDALAYYSSHFQPFQFKTLRIAEFPRYSQFAQSFANTIPFSEGVGFIMKIEDPIKDLDMVYYLTSHEVAHQWWGHQVMEANVQGNAMLSEGISQYSALMVMKHSFSPEAMQQYLKYELDNYLKGRAVERKREQPLQFVEKQPYIYYNKASLIFYALQDYIGEENLNKAIREYNQEWSYKDGPYPVSLDLLKHIHKVTPDSLQYLLTDMFQTITLFENKATEALYEEKSKTEFAITFNFSSEKIRSDSLASEKTIPINDWIDIGIFAKDQMGHDKLIYLKKHHITTLQNKIRITVKEKPVRAGIDPLRKLIDKHPDDNIIDVKKAIEFENL